MTSSRSSWTGGEARVERSCGPAGSRNGVPAYLDLALKVDGFAFVPWTPHRRPGSRARADASAGGPTATPTPLRFAPASPLDRFAIRPTDDEGRNREKKALERILRFQGRGAGRSVGVDRRRDRGGGPLSPTMPGDAEAAWAHRRTAAIPDQPGPRAGNENVATQALPRSPRLPRRKAGARGVSGAGSASAEPAPVRESLAPPLTPESTAERPSGVRRPRYRESRLADRQRQRGGAGPDQRETSPSLPGVPRVELSRAGARSPEGRARRTPFVSRTPPPPLAGADIRSSLRIGRRNRGEHPAELLAEPGRTRERCLPGGSSLVDLRVRVTMSEQASRDSLRGRE